jgi:hypothetical protein
MAGEAGTKAQVGVVKKAWPDASNVNCGVDGGIGDQHFDVGLKAADGRCRGADEFGRLA